MHLPPGPTLAGTYPDPSIQRVGDDYWLVTSTFEYFPGIPIFHSTDLVTWTQVGHVIDRLEQIDMAAVPSSFGLFAPTIRHHDGRWYVVCTLVTAAGAEHDFVVTATDPAGPWSNATFLVGARGIDPSLFFDDDGRAWFCGTHKQDAPDWPDQTIVWLQEFDTTRLELVGEVHHLWHGAVEGAVWAEGPHIYKRGDWYYLLTAEGGTEFYHAISIARSREVTGPYEGYRGNPLFTHRHLGRSHPITNVGHAELFDTSAGEWAVAMLAVRPYGGLHGNRGRETFITTVAWEDGWPVIAPGIGVLKEKPRDLQRTNRHFPPPHEWTQVRTARDAGYSIIPAASAVELTPHPTSLSDGGTPPFVGVRQKHRSFRFAAQVPFVDGAGVAARQSEVAHLSAVRRGDAVVVYVADAEIGRLPAGDGQVVLSAEDQAYAIESGGASISVDGRFLSSEVAGGFIGVWIGVLATAHSGPRIRFEHVSYDGE